MKFGVGQPVRRFEDQTLITGKGRYTDDITLPNMAQAVVVRAQAAHANIRKIDVTAARAHARRAAGADRRRREGRRARRRSLHRAAQQPRRLAAPRHAATRARRRTRCATSASRSRSSSPRPCCRRRTPPTRSRSTTRRLPAVTDARAALEQGAPQLFDGIPGNLVFDWDNDTSDFAATDAAFAKAAHVTTLEIINNRVVANSMEPRNAIGDWDAAAERPVLYTGTQGSHIVRDTLAEVVLKIPKEKLRVITPPNVGGGFGMKAFVYPEQALVVWAGEQAEASGALAVGPLRSVPLRQPGPRPLHHGRAGARRQGQVPRHPRFADRQYRRISVAGRPVHPDPLDRPDLRPLHDARDRHQREGRVHQHGAGVRLSRRRASGGVLPDRAAGRCGGARAEHDARTGSAAST